VRVSKSKKKEEKVVKKRNLFLRELLETVFLGKPLAGKVAQFKSRHEETCLTNTNQRRRRES